MRLTSINGNNNFIPCWLHPSQSCTTKLVVGSTSKVVSVPLLPDTWSRSSAECRLPVVNLAVGLLNAVIRTDLGFPIIRCVLTLANVGACWMNEELHDIGCLVRLQRSIGSPLLYCPVYDSWQRTGTAHASYFTPQPLKLGVEFN